LLQQAGAKCKELRPIYPGDYTKARRTHWLHLGTDLNTCSGTVGSEKPPLENRVWYTYAGQGVWNFGLLTEGTINKMRESEGSDLWILEIVLPDMAERVRKTLCRAHCVSNIPAFFIISPHGGMPVTASSGTNAIARTCANCWRRQ
jgi:hypothetical protein